MNLSIFPHLTRLLSPLKNYTCRRVYVCDTLQLLRSTSVRNNDSIVIVAAYSSNKDRPRLEDLKHPNTYLRHLTPAPASWLLDFRHQLKTTSPSGCFWHRVQELGSTSFFKAFACYIWAHLWTRVPDNIRLADRELKRDYSSKLDRESSTGQAFVWSDRAGF